MTILAPAKSFIAPDLFAAPLPAWPFGGLVPQSYDFIMADPPWTFELRSDKGEAKSAQAEYRCMSLDGIAALPVADLARETCLLWLWATGPMLPAQIEVMRAWGFSFVTSGAWVKRTVNDKLAFGTGYFLRSSHEPFLLGARGEPPMPEPRNVRSVVMGQVREHSRKPETAYGAAERLTTGFPAHKAGTLRRVELFSRTNRKGWDVWGDEVGKFGAEESGSGGEVVSGQVESCGTTSPLTI